ncbi:hypothetical protein, partial [Capnocytophaga sputigena]|uniref:hypothetical protein n=1 Tax=Capnocytophaga sputigena TaxID=1019 RepID=UPI0028D13D6A
MKVYTQCKHCTEELSCTTEATDRVEFAMREGEEKSLVCPNCNRRFTYEPNDFRAKPSKIGQIVALVILILGVPALIYAFAGKNYIVLGGYLLIPWAVYAIITQQDRSRVSSFNQVLFR